MAVEVQFLDPFELMQHTAQRDRQVPNRRRSERVSYWKRPTTLLDGRPANMPGWVIYGDTQPGKYTDYVSRGFRPLHQYGRVWDYEGDEDGRLYQRYGPWGAILSKPGGPLEFPVDQIVTFRWYDPKNIGGPFPQFEPMRHVRFPQLYEAHQQGLKIREYRCPECNAASYLEAIFLARHVRNAHSWDRKEILDWGTAMGIDFSREFRTRTITEVELPDFEELIAPASEPSVPVEAVALPPRPSETSEQAQQRKCFFCLKAKAGVCKKHVGKV